MTVVWHQHPAAGSSARPSIRSLSLWFALALAGLIIVFGIGYFVLSGWSNPSASGWYARVPLPVAQLRGRVAWYGEVVKLARGFAASDVRDLVTPEDLTAALDLAARRLLIARLASDYDLSVSDDELKAELEVDDELETFLVQANWSLDDYSELVLEPFILSQKVEDVLMADREYQGGALEEIVALRAKLDLGIAFEDVAQQYSQDSSAQSKGNLGYVLQSEVDVGFAPVFQLATNDVSEILETVDAFWIVRVEDSLEDVDGQRLLLRGIAVKKQGIGEIVDRLVEEHSLIFFVKK